MEKRKRRRWLWFLGAVALAVVVLWLSCTYFRALVWAARYYPQDTQTSTMVLRALLFSRGAELSQPSSRAVRTPLTEAAIWGRADIVKALLARGAAPNVKDSLGETALPWAVWSSTAESVRALLAKGADPNALWGQTVPALVMAAQHANLEVVKLLLDARADVNARTRSIMAPGSRSSPPPMEPRTAFAAALQTASSAQYKAAESRGEGEVREAERWIQRHSRAVEVAKLLLEHGARVNGAEDEVPALIQVVAWPDPADLVKRLIEKGAEVNQRSPRDGWTALRGAAAAGHSDVCGLLLKAGADPNVAGREGTTPLIAAARWKGNAKVIQALLAKGAHTDAKDKAGKTALDWAREKKREDIVRLLQKVQVE